MTERELLAAMKRERRPVDRSSLKALYRAGLIGRPTQIHPPRQHGSETVYPDGTLRQLIAVYDLRQAERRFDELRFDVWWDGHWTDPDQLRASLTTLATTALVLDTDPIDADDPLEVAEVATADLRDKPRDPTQRLMLRRLDGNVEDLRSAMQPLLMLMLGGQPIWDASGADADEPAPTELTQQLFGFDRLEELQLDGLTVRELFAADSPLVKLMDPAALVISLSDTDLSRAREIAHDLVPLATFAQTFELQRGHDAAGLRPLSIAARTPRNLRLLAVVLAAVFPEWATDTNAQATLCALREAAPKLTAIRDFLSEHPGYREYLREGSQALARLDPESREQVRRTIAEFVENHPELGYSDQPSE